MCLFPALPSAEAHKVSSASVLVEIDTEKHTYQVGAAMEVAPSEDQALNDLISPEEAARTFAEEYLTILFDKDEQKPKLEIHTETASDKDTPPELQRKQVIVNLSGEIPKNAKEFLLYIDTRCPMAVVMVFIKDKQPARRMQVVLPGEFSRPFNAEPVIEGDPFEKKTAPAIKAEPIPVIEAPKPAGNNESSPFRAGWAAFLDGTLLHLALLAAVLLLGSSWRAMLLLVCALVAGQCVGVSLEVTSEGPPGPVLPIGVIALAVGAILKKNENPSFFWWYAPILVLGFFQVSWLGLRMVEVKPFAMGFGAVQLLCGSIIALLIITLSRQKWYQSGFKIPAAVILAGYGLFLLIEDLI